MEVVHTCWELDQHFPTQFLMTKMELPNNTNKQYMPKRQMPNNYLGVIQAIRFLAKDLQA